MRLLLLTVQQYFKKVLRFGYECVTIMLYSMAVYPENQINRFGWFIGENKRISFKTQKRQ